MSQGEKVKKFLSDNGLVLLMFGLFAIFLVGLSITGYIHNNQQLAEHHQASESYGQYLVSGESNRKTGS